MITNLRPLPTRTPGSSRAEPSGDRAHQREYRAVVRDVRLIGRRCEDATDPELLLRVLSGLRELECGRACRESCCPGCRSAKQ